MLSRGEGRERVDRGGLFGQVVDDWSNRRRAGDHIGERLLIPSQTLLGTVTKLMSRSDRTRYAWSGLDILSLPLLPWHRPHVADPSVWVLPGLSRSFSEVAAHLSASTLPDSGIVCLCVRGDVSSPTTSSNRTDIWLLTSFRHG